MSELYVRMEQAQAEIALIRRLIGPEPELSLGVQESLGLLLILGRAQEAMGAYLDQEMAKPTTT